MFVTSVKLFISWITISLICSLSYAQSDAVTFGYTTTLDGLSYSRIAKGSTVNLTNSIELFAYANNTVSGYTLVNNNQTYTMNLPSGTIGFLEFNLKASNVPLAYFVSINNVPTNTMKFVSGRDLQFMFSRNMFETATSKSIKIDILRKLNNRTWTIGQTFNITLNLQGEAPAPNPNPTPTPVPAPTPGGYVPPNTTTWTRYVNNLVLNPAKLKFGVSQMPMYNIGDPCVMFDKKTNKFHAYFSSADMGSDIVVMGHAESNDGASWTLNQQIALGGGGNGTWDMISIETCSVHSVETSPGVFKYYMFYSATSTDSGPGANSDLYEVGLAVSDNPNVFTRISASQSPKGQAGLLFDIKDAFAQVNPAVVSGLVTDPEVIYENGTFKMWMFCAGQNSTGSYIEGGICYATSTNGINWTHKGTLNSLLNTSTVGVVAQQPTIIYNDVKKIYEMWLVIDDPAYANLGQGGLAVGGYYRATSTDGINWTYASKTSYDFAWNKNVASENIGLVTGPDMLFINNTYYLFYPSFTTQGVPSGYYTPYTWGLNLATKK